MISVMLYTCDLCNVNGAYLNTSHKYTKEHKSCMCCVYYLFHVLFCPSSSLSFKAYRLFATGCAQIAKQTSQRRHSPGYELKNGAICQKSQNDVEIRKLTEVRWRVSCHTYLQGWIWRVKYTKIHALNTTVHFVASSCIRYTGVYVNMVSATYINTNS